MHPETNIRILQVNTLDRLGGAAQVAWDLHRAYTDAGLESCMAVGRKTAAATEVVELGSLLARKRNTCQHVLLKAGGRLLGHSGKGFGAGRMGRALRCLALPRTWGTIMLGSDDGDYPASWLLPESPGNRPDIIHCHNLHGGYFDLRALAWLSRRFHVVVTMHDAWLLGGGCAHSFGCARWKTGCGDCPVYKGREVRDNTSHIWERKRGIYSRCRLYIAAPSRWLMDKVDGSILAQAAVETRVIPNGADLSVFYPADKKSARRAHGIPESSLVVLFVAHSFKNNIHKDFGMLRRSVEDLSAGMPGREIIFMALGDEGGTERLGNVTLKYLPYETDRHVVASYYQASDVYVHPSRADTFPNSVIEALACGVPAVATGVGGIPEQIKGLALEGCDGVHPAESATGIVVPPGDLHAMAGAIKALLENEGLRMRLGSNAAVDARARFGLNRCADEYMSWYREIIGSSRTGASR